MEADQVATFVDETCSAFPSAHIAVAELYRAYLDWADESGIRRRVNKNNLVSRLERLGYQKTRGTGGVRQVSGLTLHPSSSSTHWHQGRPWAS